MSEETEAGNTSGDTAAADEFKAITSQEELNNAIKARLDRERAKYADYKDLKAKADKLDEIENANRSEAEKATARITELETELANVRAESTRLRIASEHGITDSDDIRLFLTGTDEETLTAQAQRLADRTADRKKHGNHSPNEGKTPAASDKGSTEEREFVRGLFESAQ